MPNRATGEVLPGLGVVRDIGHLRDVISRFTSMEEAKAAAAGPGLPDEFAQQIEAAPDLKASPDQTHTTAVRGYRTSTESPDVRAVKRAIRCNAQCNKRPRSLAFSD